MYIYHGKMWLLSQVRDTKGAKPHPYFRRFGTESVHMRIQTEKGMCNKLRSNFY